MNKIAILTKDTIVVDRFRGDCEYGQDPIKETAKVGTLLRKIRETDVDAAHHIHHYFDMVVISGPLKGYVRCISIGTNARWLSPLEQLARQAE